MLLAAMATQLIRAHPSGIGRSSRRSWWLRASCIRARHASDARIESRGGAGRPAPGAPPTTALLIVLDAADAPIIQRPDTRFAAASGGALVGVVQPAEDRDADDGVPIVGRRPRRDTRFRHALAQPLVRPGLVAVGDVPAEDPPQVRLAEQQHMIEARASDATQEALGDGVGARRAARSAGRTWRRCRAPATGDTRHAASPRAVAGPPRRRSGAA